MDKRWNNKVLSTADIAVNWKQLVWYYKALHFRILLKNPPQIHELALQMGSVAWYYIVTPQFYMLIKGHVIKLYEQWRVSGLALGWHLIWLRDNATILLNC